MKVNVLSRINIEADSHDQQIKKFLSTEVLDPYIKDKACNSLLRFALFSFAKVSWDEVLKIALKLMPELKWKLREYKLESSVDLDNNEDLPEIKL